MPARGLRVIAGAHDELQKMLQQDGGWLAKGKGWDAIPSGSHHASRFEKVVAQLCGCSVQLVQKARSRSKKNMLVEPKVRGRKRHHSDSARTASSGDTEPAGAAALWEGGVAEASLQTNPARHRLGNVRGKFLPSAADNPEQHAIGLTLGRLMVWSFVNGIPRSAMTGLMTQLTLAGVQLGDKYQDHNALMTFAGVIFCVLQRLMRCRLSDAIPNLPFPSAFRLIWDGITLRNGATVLPILVVFTSHAGEIVSEVVDIPLSAGSSGILTASTVCKVLDDVLAIRKRVRYFSKAGLPIRGAAAEVCRPRTDVLTSMLVDRAYSGSTGNKADRHLADMFGIAERVGLADKVHCCTGAASQVWNHKPKRGTAATAAASGIVAEAEDVAEAEEEGGSNSDSSSCSSSSSSSGGGSGGVRCPYVRVRRVPLCQGPGTDSAPLSSLVARPGAAGRHGLQTWNVDDERVSGLRGTVGKWTSLCTSLSKIFSRGVNRNFLARAYRDHKIARCPRILAPTKVRMIVYCGKFLDQSLRHHGVRVQALRLAIGKLAQAKDQHSQKKLQRLQAHARVLLSPMLLLPLLVNDLIHIRHGYQSGCVLLQQTKAVFFKLHLHAAQMWWQCMWLGTPQWERHMLLHRICWSSGQVDDQEQAWYFKCRFCDLVAPTGQALFSHLKHCHPHTSWIYQQRPECYEPWKVLRKKRGASETKSLSNMNAGQDSFAALALRQPGVIVPSLETSCCFLRFFVLLLTYVGVAGIAAAHPERHGISVAEWVLFACFSGWLPSHVRRTCPNFWRVLPEAVLADTFRGSPLSKSAAQGQGLKVNLVEAMRKRTVLEMLAAGEHLCLVLQAGQTFMRDLGRSHEENVVYSHGDHIPLKVRNASVVAFWLPDVLDVAFDNMSSQQARHFWESRVSAFLEVSEYVAKRMQAYQWPAAFDLKAQYRDLILHWWRLCRRPDVRTEILRPREEKSKQGRRSASIVAVDCRWCESTTGLVEHGCEVILPGLEFKYSFQWEVFWAMVHTGKLPSGAVLDWVPDKCAAAFAVFHFSGMFGTSEAHAESVGSTLKRYAKTLGTSRVVESTMLRQHGLSGCGGGSEDAFLEVCWSHFFGSSDASKFSFLYRNSKKRAIKYAEGCGSKILDGYVKKHDAGVRWSQRDLLLVAEELEVGPRISKSLQWGKILKERRCFATG